MPQSAQIRLKLFRNRLGLVKGIHQFAGSIIRGIDDHLPCPILELIDVVAVNIFELDARASGERASMD